VLLLAAAALAGCRGEGGSAGDSVTGTETIVILRHGEKAEGGLGQLSCAGLQRALALPPVLARFGRPAAIFAPNPAVEMKEGPLEGRRYSYLRPLATIEPTAVRLGMPVNTQIGYADMKALAAAVTAPPYAGATVLVVWEHKYARRLARLLMGTYGGDEGAVPSWPAGDFDSLYVLRLTRHPGGAPAITFVVQPEGLNGRLPATCPEGDAGAPPPG
jgi:hypothetical protein